MLCPRCGESNALGTKFCLRCGVEMPPEGPPATPGDAAPGVGGSVLGLGTPRTPQPVYRPPFGPTETNGKAVASLICGLFMWFFPAAIAAVILGHVSLSEIKRSAGRLIGRGMAMTGLVLGYVGLFFIPFILIIAAIAIPNLLRARMAANEASAVGTLRVINTAAISYAASYSNGFPPSLTSLDGSSATQANCDHAHLIAAGLASGQRNGYVFTYISTGTQVLHVGANQDTCTVPGSSSYVVHADPIKRGTTGMRGFYTDQTGIIRMEADAPASSDSAPIE